MKTNLEIRPILWALMRSKTSALLVAAQVAISLALLANALYIVNLRLSTAARPSGMADEDNIFTAYVKHLGPVELHGQVQSQETAIMRAVPGVISAGRASQIPLSTVGWVNSISVDRKQVKETAQAAVYYSPDSLIKIWGLRLIEGRDFQEDEFPEAPTRTSPNPAKVAVITKALAEKLFPGGEKVIGKTFYREKEFELRVIGVVEKLQTGDAEIGSNGEYSILLPRRFNPSSSALYTIRAEPGRLDQVIKDVSKALRNASPLPMLINIDTIEQHRENRYRSEKGLAWMLIAVSALLIVVTASGIVGISTLWVSQRRKQIGVRRAVGGRKIDILRYFIIENVLITTGGVIAGVLLALALNQFLVSQFELTKLPLTYFVLAPIILWALGVIAVFVPAWRAASISPAIATRSV